MVRSKNHVFHATGLHAWPRQPGFPNDRCFHLTKNTSTHTPELFWAQKLFPASEIMFISCPATHFLPDLFPKSSHKFCSQTTIPPENCNNKLTSEMQPFLGQISVPNIHSKSQHQKSGRFISNTPHLSSQNSSNLPAKIWPLIPLISLNRNIQNVLFSTICTHIQTKSNPQTHLSLLPVHSFKQKWINKPSKIKPLRKFIMRHKLGIYFNTHNTTTQLSELGGDILASHPYLSLVSLLGMPVRIPYPTTSRYFLVSREEWRPSTATGGVHCSVALILISTSPDHSQACSNLTPSVRKSVGPTLTPPAVCIPYLFLSYPSITHRQSPTSAPPLVIEITTRSPFVGLAHPGRRSAGRPVGTIPTMCPLLWVHRPLPHHSVITQYHSYPANCRLCSCLRAQPRRYIPCGDPSQPLGVPTSPTHWTIHWTPDVPTLGTTHWIPHYPTNGTPY